MKYPLQILALSSFAYTLNAFAGMAIVGSDQPYFIHKVEDQNVEMVYTEQNQYAAKTALNTEPLIARSYEETFGYKLDSTLFVGIISDQNQIANAFSTQVPLNMQINYIGGAQTPDHFGFNSWLKGLLYHETAHNYQMNPKASKITQSLYSVVGGGEITLGMFPFLSTTPNNALSSFLLEGNAVLNESWHNNGGRLYNGHLLAESIMQAKEGNVTPQFLFNQDINAFPFYDRHYIVGGFFQLYLAQKYGLKKVNSFFYNHSKSWLWPYRTNRIFQMTFDHDFETEIAQYNDWLLEKGNDFVVADGEKVAASQRFSALNSDKDEIFYLTSDGQLAPELVKLNKSTRETTKERESYLQSKVVKVDDEYFTQASNHVDPSFIAQGLFDENAQVKEGTEGKMIQGYIQGKPVYFDVPSSFEKPQLYVGDEFYAEVNSSVFIDDNDNLYYFVQKDKTRTLYKNKTAIFTLNDYYGFVSDVDAQGRISFVANSKNGSSLYRLDPSNKNKVERLVAGDNVVDARLVNDDEVLLITIKGDEYEYLIAPITVTDEAPFSRTYFFENDPYFTQNIIADDQAEMSKQVIAETESPVNVDDATNVQVEDESLQASDSKTALLAGETDANQNANDEQSSTAAMEGDEYNRLTNLHYSGTDSMIGMSSNDGESRFVYSFSANFTDPLLTNSVSIFASQDAGALGVAGISYENSAYYMPFQMSVYGVYNEGDASEYYKYDPATNRYDDNPTDIQQDSRHVGGTVSAQLPIIQSGYNYVGLGATFYQDPDNNQRSPTVLGLNLSHFEHYGKAVDAYFNHEFNTFVAEDRSDISAGAQYRISHAIPWTSFIGFGVKGVKSDFERDAITNDSLTRGVKLSPFANSVAADPTTIVMPSLHRTRYVKQVGVAQIDFKKQFDYQLLFFTFPFSLTQETAYVKQRYYNVEDYLGTSTKTQTIEYNETTLGVSFDMLTLNTMTIPINFEYIINDNTYEKGQFNFSFGGTF